ncbi:MAG: zinc metalloprotease HtpX [Magnetococcales bacterium]|nr:zinc metalloprotease HtpX [Magnetococcales bacterium]
MNFMRTTMLLAALTALFLVAGQALGGKGGMMIALVLAIGMNFFAYWFSDKMVLKMYNAIEVGPDQAPELYEIVEELARRAELPMPRVYVIEDPSPNAFATGRNPENAAVAATTGIMQMLTREEIAGVMAHEMAHVLHRDILIGTISATIAGAITALANMAQWAMIFGALSGRDDDESSGGGIGGIIMIILAPIAASLIQMAISRSREYQADRTGAELCGNPLWLASALEKIHHGSQQIPLHEAESHPATAHMFIANPLSGRSLASLFSTHPPMEERIHLLREMVR